MLCIMFQLIKTFFYYVWLTSFLINIYWDRFIQAISTKKTCSLHWLVVILVSSYLFISYFVEYISLNKISICIDIKLYSIYVTISANTSVQSESWTVPLICATMISIPWSCTVFLTAETVSNLQTANISCQYDFPHEKTLSWTTPNSMTVDGFSMLNRRKSVQ